MFRKYKQLPIDGPRNKVNNEEAETTWKTCRICLNYGEIHIFGNPDFSGDIITCTRIKIVENDGLPQHICTMCHDLLANAVQFTSLAHETNQILQQKMNKSSPLSDRENPEAKSPSPQYSEEFLDQEFLVQEPVELSDQESDISDQKPAFYQESEEFLYQEDKHSSDEESDFSPTYLECDSTDDSQDFFEDNTHSNELDKQTDSSTYKAVVSHSNKTDAAFHCEVCELTFNNKKETSEHLLLHNSCKECEICNNIMHENAYSVHMKLHRKLYEQRIAKNKVECKKCGKAINKSYLKFHMLNHGSFKDKLGRLKQCPVCDKYVNSYYFSGHMQRMHHTQEYTCTSEEYMKTCPICDRLIIETKIKEHIASHGKSKNKEYVCDKCGKIFKYYSAFQTHCLTHTGKLTFKCEFCPYRGLHLGLLKVHVRTHTKDYSYECSVCKKKFITKSNLSKHESSHKPPRFSCTKCGKKFAFKRSLEMHIKVIHLNIRTEKCGVCDKTFGSKDAVRAHEKKIHNIRPRSHSCKGRKANYLKEAELKCSMQKSKA